MFEKPGIIATEELMEVMGAMPCKVTREEFQPMEPEEVDRALTSASLAKYMLDLCPSWFIMAVWKECMIWSGC